MIHSLNEQAWFFPAANELESPQAPDSLRLVFAITPVSLAPIGRVVTQPKPNRPLQKHNTKRSLALSRCCQILDAPRRISIAQHTGGSESKRSTAISVLATAGSAAHFKRLQSTPHDPSALTK
jgi:hypothetical protein